MYIRQEPCDKWNILGKLLYGGSSTCIEVIFASRATLMQGTPRTKEIKIQSLAIALSFHQLDN